MPSEWLRRRKRDQFHRLAKEHGYRSRASFKLLQAVRRYRFLKRGDRVLDLGAAPGGWLQAAREIVGAEGNVLGVDKQAIESLRFDNVRSLTADISSAEVVGEIHAAGYAEFDVVLSDLAPDVSGVWELDQLRQIDLARAALNIARNLLKPSGNMMVKVFQGSELKEFENEMRPCFEFLRIFKPAASRAESAELYFLGLGFHRQRIE